MKALVKDLFKGCLTIPNLLSVIRIALIPVFAILYLNGDKVLAASILFVSGLTDLFDGKIARKFNQISALGKILDPVADKLTQITVAVIFFILFRQSEDLMMNIFGWIFLVFLIKEAVMLVGGLIMLSLGIRPGAAEIYGKLATVVFYSAMTLIMAFGPEVGAFAPEIEMNSFCTGALVVISAVMTVLAFLSYLPEIIRQFKQYFKESKTVKK